MLGRGRHLEIKALLYFMTVTEQGSFTRAAKQRGVTQPALSFQISQLEDQLGVQLFERTRDGVQLTIYGRVLYDRVLPIVRDLVGLAGSLSDRSAHKSRTPVRFGMPPPLSQMLLPTVIKAFLDDHPDIPLELREDFSTALREEVEAGTLDFAIGSWRPDNKGLILEFSYEEDLYLISREDIAGPSGTPCRMDDIPNLHLCCVADKHPLGALIASHIANGDILPSRVVVVDGPAIGAQLAQKPWAAIVPETVAAMITARDSGFMHPIVFPTLLYRIYGISNSKVPLRPMASLLKTRIVEALSSHNVGRLVEFPS